MADIVCVHGLAGSPRWWQPVLSQLEERYEVELLDMRDVAPAEGAEWLAGHMSPETTVIAHSLGGLLAAQVAARRPLRKLVLVAPAGVPTGRHPVLEFLALLATVVTVRPLFLLTLALDALRWGPLALIRGGRYAIGSDLRHDLQHIAVPTLVVWGERDRLVPTRLAQTWTDSIPNARLELIPGTAHVPMVENPSAFVRAVLDFLEEPDGCRIIGVPASLRIERVADLPELADVVAGWHFAEWGHLTPTLSLADRVEGVFAAAAGTYVALEGDEPVGTAGLVAHDMDTHPDLGPWLAGVYVTPERRRHGVAAALTRHVADTAAAEGATTLYLYTASAQSYWERVGWYRIGDEPYLGETVTVMGLHLSD